ncbi:MAG: SDR family oxidoreductase [Armatimonadetes bacterium]|nr:SDR family oxidoreductase [Armatimonadota bacterium]MCX7967516.1 SDR family oxidoreductase [Armatimonadota bacterium]MDW8142474.1 SDR family oxidoreductase [Armatimonadota bacterium]
MICVTAATGQLGQKVVEFLLEKVVPEELVLAVRNTEKAKGFAQRGTVVREADYDFPETLEKAFKGVRKLLLISSPSIGRRVEQHRNVIEAAKRSGVETIVYTSVLHADRSRLGLIAEEHRQTEEMIRSSGLDYTILRNGWYVENYASLVKTAVSHGLIIGCAGEGKISAAPRSDYAEAAAVVLTTVGHSGKIYELAGDEAFTMGELATEISRQTGKEISYKNVNPEEYVQWLVSTGVSEAFARFLASIDEAIAEGDLFDDSHQLSQILGRPTTSWRLVIAEILHHA